MLGSSATPADAADKDCDDFASQRQAQDFFNANGGPGSDPHRLDADGDGKACEALPCPCGAGGGEGGGGHDSGGRNGGGDGDRKPDLRKKARVVDVVDGDTIQVRSRRRTKDVRLIGIDTPEVYGGRECGGPQASESMKELLDPGDRVTLIRDLSQDARDRYGRLLRYVERGGLDLGRKQVLRGEANVYVYDRPFKRVRSYRVAQRRAKSANRGAWGDCGGRFRARSADRSVAGSTAILCANSDGSEYRRKERPRKCAIFGRNGIFAGGVNLKKIRWKGWGQKRARAKAIECGFHLPCADIRARVRASKPRTRCGHRVYTRIKVRTRFGRATPRPAGCPGPVF